MIGERNKAKTRPKPLLWKQCLYQILPHCASVDEVIHVQRPSFRDLKGSRVLVLKRLRALPDSGTYGILSVFMLLIHNTRQHLRVHWLRHAFVLFVQFLSYFKDLARNYHP